MIKNRKILNLLMFFSILGTLIINASFSRKLGKRKSESQEETFRPIPSQRPRIKPDSKLDIDEIREQDRGSQVMDVEFGRTLTEFARQVASIKPISTNNDYYNNIIIDEFDSNQLPNVLNSDIEGLRFKVYWGRVNVTPSGFYIFLPNKKNVKTYNVIFSGVITSKESITQQEKNVLYGITKIEILIQNKNLLEKIKYLSDQAIFSIVEYKNTGKKENVLSLSTPEYIYNYELNNTFWGGSKKSLITLGIAGCTILGIAALAPTGTFLKIGATAFKYRNLIYTGYKQVSNFISPQKIINKNKPNIYDLGLLLSIMQNPGENITQYSIRVYNAFASKIPNLPVIYGNDFSKQTLINTGIAKLIAMYLNPKKNKGDSTKAISIKEEPTKILIQEFTQL